MSDQAENLRRLVHPSNNGENAKVIAVVSGKGGVGKSNVCLNFGISMSQLGKKVAILDLDIGMANLDILMGLTPSYHILDLLDQQLSIWDIIEEGPSGISYIAGGSGFSKFVELNEERMNRFFSQLELIGQHFDFIFLDMGAGATKESIQFILAAHEVFVVTTPEPTSITDAYAMVKYIYLKEEDKLMHLIANRVDSEKEGTRTLESFKRVVEQFLKKEVTILGSIPNDEIVRKAVKSQKPFVIMDQQARASKAMRELALTYLGHKKGQSVSFGHFLSKIKRLFQVSTD